MTAETDDTGGRKRGPGDEEIGPAAKRQHGDPSPGGILDFLPVVPPFCEDAAGGSSECSWDLGKAKLERKELATRRLHALQTLRDEYKKQTTWAVEALGMCRAEDSADQDKMAELQRERGAFAARLPELERLEGLASASCMRELSSQGAMAMLVGRQGRFFIRSISVTIGRSSKRSKVDVDLTAEAGPLVSKVSRQQALLEIHCDKMWRITNTGRGPMLINAMPLLPGRSSAVQQLSTIEVGSVQLLMLCNSEAVARCVKG